MVVTSSGGLAWGDQVTAMCVSPNLRAVAMCEVVKDESKSGGGATSAAAGAGAGAVSVSTDAEGKAGTGGAGDAGGKDEVVDKFETKSQVSVYHIASRRRMRTMSIPMKGGVVLCTTLPMQGGFITPLQHCMSWQRPVLRACRVGL